MKKLLLSLGLLLAMATAAPVSARTFGFGVMGGLNVSKLDADHAQNNNGWYAGLTAKCTIPVLNFGVDGSLLYSLEKAGISGNETDAKFISIPVNLRYDFQFPLISKVLVPYLFAGPQFDWNINNASIVPGTYGEYGEAASDSGESTASKGGLLHKYKLKDATWKANFGLGVLLLNHVQVSYSYSLPVSNSWESVTAVKDLYSNTKMSTHKIGVAYYF
jgi:hypothetical protein